MRRSWGEGVNAYDQPDRKISVFFYAFPKYYAYILVMYKSASKVYSNLFWIVSACQPELNTNCVQALMRKIFYHVTKLEVISGSPTPCHLPVTGKMTHTRNPNCRKLAPSPRSSSGPAAEGLEEEEEKEEN